MPKLVTRATIATSDQAKATPSSAAVLRSYWCLCGDFLLVMQGSLENLPRRRMDGASIIRCQPGPKGVDHQPARKFKLNNVVPGKRCLIKRRGTAKLEVRQPFLCQRCNSPVAYQTSHPPAGSGAFLYIIKGGLTPHQGQIPEDAFDGEELLEGLDDGEEDEDSAAEGVQVAEPISTQIEDAEPTEGVADGHAK